jgi:mannose-1-phosphate guanylyltransferase
MKAMLLAAGKGVRLHPFTEHVPKCLIPICGQPLLGIWFEMLRRHGVNSVLVNTHHLAGEVHRYVKENPVQGLDVQFVHEPELLGSAGTVLANRDFVRAEQDFFIVYADNLTAVDLTRFLQFHREKKSPFSLGLFQTQQPSECGIVLTDADGRVEAFEEKPKHPRGNWANSGLYIATQELFGSIPARRPCDFGFNVLPAMLGKMYAYRIHEFYCDVGTPERLEYANREWARLAAQKGNETC